MEDHTTREKKTHHIVTKGAWSKEMINVGSTKSDLGFKLFIDLKKKKKFRFEKCGEGKK